MATVCVCVQQDGLPRVRGTTLDVGKRFLFSLNCPNQLWDPHRFLLNGCRNRGFMLTAHFHLRGQESVEL